MDAIKLMIENILYPAMESFKGNRTREYMQMLSQNARLSPDELHAMQRELLRALLHYCISNVPAYRNFNALNREIDADPYAALAKLPVLTKAEYKKNPDAYISSLANKDNLIENRTGGSTGEPTVFYMDRITVEHYEAARFRGLAWHGITPGSRSVMIWGHQYELRANAQASFRLKERMLKNRIVISAYQLYERDMAEHVRRIESYRPEYIYGYATPLYEFSRLMLKLGLRLSFKPKAVVSTSETLLPHYVPEIENAFGCPVLNEYGARDGGIIAYTAPCGKMHISADNAVYEILDPRSLLPVKPGEVGALAVTDLHNIVQPRLRYLLGDMASISPEPCACGLSLPVMDKIEGRTDDLFITADGRMFYPDIFNRFAKLYAPDSIMRFQIVQHSPTRASIKIIPSENAQKAQIERFLDETRTALSGAELLVEMVEDIPKTASGKTRYAMRMFDL